MANVKFWPWLRGAVSVSYQQQTFPTQLRSCPPVTWHVGIYKLKHHFQLKKKARPSSPVQPARIAAEMGDEISFVTFLPNACSLLRSYITTPNVLQAAKQIS